MSSNGTRRRPSLERLEDRLALSNGLPGNDLAVASGAVAAPGQATQVSVTIPASAFGNRQSIVIGTATSPGPGSTINPVLKSAVGPDGEALPVHPGAPYPGIFGAASAFIEVDRPGTLTLTIAGVGKTSGSFQATAYLPGDVNGDGQVTVADAELFVKDFGETVNPKLESSTKAPSPPKSGAFNLAADANRNGVVAMGDGKYLLRNEVLLTPKHPLTIDNVTLPPGEAAPGPTSTNSGGKTYLQNVTVLGHTTPGSIVFTDVKLGYYFFNDTPVAADAKGDFSIPYKLSAGINTLTLMAIDPFGQQTIFSYPVFWIPYAARGSKLK